MHCAPFADETLWREIRDKAHFWGTEDFYGVDLTPLREEAVRSYFRQCVVDAFETELLLSQPVSFAWDWTTLRADELESLDMHLEFKVQRAGPVHVTDGAQYSQTVAAAKLCVVDFTASWCGPCRQIAPAFERMALANPTVHFLKVDVDEVQDVAARENVRSMPTFKLYRYGSKVEEFSGADPNRLQAWLTRYLPTVA